MNKILSKSSKVILIFSLIWMVLHTVLIILYMNGFDRLTITTIFGFLLIGIITQVHTNKIFVIISCLCRKTKVRIILDIASIVWTALMSLFYWFIVMFLGVEGLAMPELYYVIVIEFSAYAVVGIIKIILDRNS